MKQLSMIEQEEFSRLRGMQNGLEERTIEQALKYYVEYKNNTNAGHVLVSIYQDLAG